MTDIALFHSVLGVRPGITDAATRLRADGHQVLVVDQYDARVFNDYDEAGRFVEQVGFPELMHRAVQAVHDLPDGFLAAGFSNGAGMAEYMATQRPCSGVLMLSGALPLSMLGSETWPAAVPAQIHYSEHDPFRSQEWIDAVLRTYAAPAPRSRSSTTPAPATCSPTPACLTSTTSRPPRCCGSARSPSAAHPTADAGRSSDAGP